MSKQKSINKITTFKHIFSIPKIISPFLFIHIMDMFWYPISKEESDDWVLPDSSFVSVIIFTKFYRNEKSYCYKYSREKLDFCSAPTRIKLSSYWYCLTRNYPFDRFCWANFHDTFKFYRIWRKSYSISFRSFLKYY